jgi:hypothetical protein
MPRQTPSASDFTSVVRSSAIANDVASKPAGSPGAAKSARAAVSGGGGLGSLGAIGSIVKQSVVAKAMAPPPVKATVKVVPLGPIQKTGTETNAVVVSYDAKGVALWSAKIAPIRGYSGYGVTTDSDGNVYVTGGSSVNTATTAFNSNGTPFTIRTIATNNGFVVKYNSAGFVQWVASIVTVADDYGKCIATDSNGNVYVGGGAGGSTGETTMRVVNSNGQDGVSGRTTNDLTAFLVKFNTSGTSQWMVTYGAANSSAANSVYVDTSGNLFLVGHLAGNGYIRKYDTNGNVIWTSHADSGWPAATAYFGVSGDSNGNVYAVGRYRRDDGNTRLFNNDYSSSFGSLPATDLGGEVFLVKYNGSGVTQWAATIISSSNVRDIGYAVAVDSSGNIYITGQISNASTTFNHATGTTFTTRTSLGNTEAFVVKYNTSGIIQWVTKVASVGADAGYAIVVDSQDSIYVAGQGGNGGVLTAYNEGNTPFSTTIPNTSSADGFLVKYNTSGAVQWITRVGGGSFDAIYGLAIDTTGKLYAVGEFDSTLLSIYDA